MLCWTESKGNTLTRFPTESRDVDGLEVDADHPDYKVPSICSAPGCSKFSDHAHHLFSRGLMGGAYTWVRFPDGHETGNLIPLCYHHHEKVTNNQVAIVYENGSYIWDEGAELKPLSWQPPRKPVFNDPRQQVKERLGITEAIGSEAKPTCPSCGRTLPKQKLEGEEPEEKKIRKTWALAVPWTAEEDGADVLDALLQAATDKMDEFGLDWGSGHKVKYYQLSTALGLFVTHADMILSNE